MLKISGLTKKFKKRTVLDDINLELEFGNIYGFTGANGSGKSVFFKIICGFLKADGGTVALDGKVIGRDIDFLPELGVLIEKPGFIENYTQLENLRYLAQIKGIIKDEEIRAALELVGLDPANREKVKNFSLGMRQRLAIAQAIMEHQKILVLDEPFNGLDKQGAAQIKRLLFELKSPERLILLTSHIPGDIEELADAVFEFTGGKIVPVNPQNAGI
ncbi:MAG: ATP-binding cassette domain-containing protein [bacterium]|nr:ATP-binding cassette domain-containing protein [bacterium]